MNKSTIFLFRQKLISQIQNLPSPTGENVPEILNFLPEGEYHEFGLLFYSYLLKEMGYRNIYLGQSVPFYSLVKLYQARKPYAILTAFVAPTTKEAIETYLK